MGYYTYFSGSYDITPEIPEALWPDTYRESGDGYFVFTQQDGTQTVAAVNGKIAVVGQPGHTHAEFRYDESLKAYDFEERLSELVDRVKAHGSVMDGVVYGSGEDDNDRWRVRVENNTIYIEKPKMVWPNGDTEQL